jgi:Helix-loop-helix DNA-binding domain
LALAAPTPLEGYSSIPEYGKQQEYFDALNSSTIDTQRGPQSTITTTLSVDLYDVLSSRLIPAVTAKRQRRETYTSPRPSGRSRSIKQRPAIGSQTGRRRASLTKLPAIVLNAIPPESKSGSRPKASSATSRGTTSSDSSISTERLSDNLVPPNAFAQSQSIGDSKPANPMTMMVMHNEWPFTKDVPRNARIRGDTLIEDVRLPESTTRPILSLLDSGKSTDPKLDTSRLSAKSARFSITNTLRPSTITPSVRSPDVAERPGSRSNTTSGSKWQGTNFATISPVSRRTTPNVTPLMPASTLGMPSIPAETTAHYLASKSNYQNILEGTNLLGVLYPEAWVENLNMKCNSHKRDEQSRRKRINSAVKEIEALLPQQIMEIWKEKRASLKGGNTSDKDTLGLGTSQATTMEMAIVYIKSLQDELKITREKLNLAKEKSI